MIDLFTPWIELQEKAIAFQKSQLEAAQRVMSAGEDFLAAQKAMQSAARANMAALESWAALWGLRK